MLRNNGASGSSASQGSAFAQEQANRSRPKLVAVVPQLEPRGGMEQAVLRLAESLASRWDLRFIVLSGPVDRVPTALQGRVETMRLAVRFYRLPLAAWRLRGRLRKLSPETVILAT